MHDCPDALIGAAGLLGVTCGTPINTLGRVTDEVDEDAGADVVAAGAVLVLPAHQAATGIMAMLIAAPAKIT
jgi:hypothetical protein